MHVELIQLPAAVLDALGAADLETARALSPVPLTEYNIGPDCLGVWKRRSAQVRDDPPAAEWITAAVIDPVTGLNVGRAGFHGPPDAVGMVEVGYGIDPSYRRQGYARAALEWLLARAAREPDVRVVRATISPDNAASRNLVAQFGFVESGEQWDEEDGVETIFEVEVDHRTRVAVLDDYQSVARASADFGPLHARAEVVVFGDHLADEDALVDRLGAFDVIIAMRERTPFPAGLLERLPQLKLLVTTGPTNASIDVEAATHLNVTVCRTGYSSTAAAEMTWGLVLALARQIPAEDAATRAGKWQTTIGRELSGATLGLLGLGHIGTQIARYGQAFGMNVIAWSQNLTAERAAEVGVEAVTKADLFTRADIVSVHLRGSPRTVGLVGADELRQLGPDGLLINTSRGPIVDEPALIAALADGTIAGAGLDVFDVEPLPSDHPLRRAPNTVITPHIGYVTWELYSIFYRDAVADVLAWLDGNPVRRLN